MPVVTDLKNKKNEGAKAKNSGGVIRGLLGKGTLVIAGLLGAGGAAGCGGARTEAPKPPLDVRVTMVAPVGKACPSKEDADHWKEVKLSIVGDHVLNDGKWYLKTIEVEGKKRVAVWELLEGDMPSAMKPSSRVTASIDEKDGRLDFDGHIYFKARDPGAWERGRKVEKSPPPKTEITPPTPAPKPAEEKIVPLTTTELSKPLVGRMTVMGNQLTVFDEGGKYHVFSLYAGPPYPYWSAPFAGMLYVDPKGTRGERRILLDVGWSTIPGPRGIVRIPPTRWQWLETGQVKK